MAKWLQIVETNCADEAREAEFNDWYDNTHIPDVLETPGFIRATRYENTRPSEGQGKFMAAYEIETDDIKGFMKASGDNLARKREEGRFSDLTVLVSRGLYRLMGSTAR